MSSGSGARLAWGEVAPNVRAEVERILGGTVVAARSQAGGFSPGSADRVVTATGRRAFVKAAALATNPETPGIHRAEVSIAAKLPADVPAPRLLGAVDDGDWVALVYEDVEGRHPVTPWRADELEAVLDALHTLGGIVLPDDLALADAGDVFAPLAGGWDRLAAAGGVPSLPDGFDGWVAERMEELRDAAARAPADIVGDRLVHFDVRADNVLIRPDGKVVLVDWPWATRGAGWFDALSLLVNVRYFDPQYDVESVAAQHPAFDEMSRDAATRLLVAFAGYFVAASARPPAPGIPTLREFQHDQGVAVLRWLRERGF